MIWFWLSSWIQAVRPTKRSFSVQPLSNLRSRSLSDSAISTTDCSNIRLEPYQAQLQLVYEYSVEFEGGQISDLSGLERAIAYAVAFELNMCDDLDRPLYKIKTNTRHNYSKTGK
jgi:hypothetical protein